ncbi:hypothetical protein [Erwinia persicina]|uniref:hypothetical protein n=1 Tax=Erwinia persicina TaxID=55211 RepID=UPI000A891120|nr:hypothetical protein [Erwinia persicina]
MFTSYYFYMLQQAKDDSFSVSDFCAIAAIVISIAAPFATSYFSKRNSVKETFWMREILIPQFSSVLFDFIKESPERYRTSSNLGQFYSNYALGIINTLRSSSRVLGVASDSLMKEIQGHIGSFEDEIMDADDQDKYIQLVSEFSRNLVLSIQKAQFGA